MIDTRGLAPRLVALSVNGRRIAWTVTRGRQPRVVTSVFIGTITGRRVRQLTEVKAAKDGPGSVELGSSGYEALAWVGTSHLVVFVVHTSDDGDGSELVSLSRGAGARQGVLGMFPPSRDSKLHLSGYDDLSPYRGRHKVLAVEHGIGYQTNGSRCVIVNTAPGTAFTNAIITREPSVLYPVSDPRRGPPVTSVSGGPKGILCGSPAGYRTPIAFYLIRRDERAPARLLQGLPSGATSVIAEP